MKKYILAVLTASLVFTNTNLINGEEKKWNEGENIAPYTIKLGFQRQKIGDIRFEENAADALTAGDYTLKISPSYDGLSFAGLKLYSDRIEITDIKNNGNEIKFTIKNGSNAPSFIAIEDIVISIDRGGYDGEYYLEFTEDKRPNDLIAKFPLIQVPNSDEKEYPGFEASALKKEKEMKIKIIGSFKTIGKTVSKKYLLEDLTKEQL